MMGQVFANHFSSHRVLSRRSATRRSTTRRGATLPAIIGAIALVGLLIGFFVVSFFSGDDQTDLFNPITVKVERGDFVAQVLDQGQIQSSENVEIRCEVRARNTTTTVLNVTPEASNVEPGDFLIQLDSTSFEKELEEQRIAMANAKTTVIQSESILASANATLREYIEGTFLEEKMTIENEINAAIGMMLTAKQQRQQAEETYEYNRKLQARGFITSQALQAADFERNKTQVDVDNAANQKKLALKRLEVLVDITKEKNIVQLEADIKAAQVKLESDRQAAQVEAEKLAEIEMMVTKCRIVVPPGVRGQVSYARESSRRGTDWELEEGATARENQVLIRIPNPEKMEVKALINEQSIAQIEPGMACDIRVDALNNRTLNGVVTRVNQYAESSSWMSSSVRKYAVFVKIFEPPLALKPGMNASVTVQVREVPDVLLAPIQTVYAVQGRAFCLVQQGDSWETREIQIDGDNSQYVLITGGLEEGDVLVMNPGAYENQLDLPEIPVDPRIELPEDKAEEISQIKATAAAEEEADGKTQRPKAPAGVREKGGAGGPRGPGGGRGPGGRGQGGRGQGGSRPDGGGRPGGTSQ